MADLLKKVVLGTKGKTPLMLEFPVNPETSPFLVTAAGKSKLVWIPNSNGTVKAGVRKNDLETLNLDITREVALVGLSHQWGNVHPLTSEGLEKAVEHLKFYGIENVEVLVGGSGLPFITEHSVAECSWLHGSCAVVVPKDRDFVGIFASVGNGFLALVHNPSRGIAVLGEP